jgi:hypothetical protein
MATPGIPRIGAVGAARLLNRHGAIEAFPASVLGERRDEALLVKDLATLRSEAALFADADALHWRGPTPAFAGWTERMNAPRLLERCLRRLRSEAGRPRPRGEGALARASAFSCSSSIGASTPRSIASRRLQAPRAPAGRRAPGARSVHDRPDREQGALLYLGKRRVRRHAEQVAHALLQGHEGGVGTALERLVLFSPVRNMRPKRPGWRRAKPT